MRQAFKAAALWHGALGGHRGLVALTVLAAVLRFATLDVQSFWQDEAITAGQVIRPGVVETLAQVRATESTPPLYYGLAWAWAELFGTGEVGLRSLSALVGTATVPVAYGAAARISRRAGLVAAALTATNPMLVWYSQEARSYSLLVFLAALSFLFFVRALGRPSRGFLVGWAASSALALVTHYFAVLVVVPEAVWLLARSGDRRRKAVAVGGTVAAGLAVFPFAQDQASAGRAGWIATIDLRERLTDLGENFLVGGGPGQIDALVPPTVALACAGLLLLAVSADSTERGGGLIALVIGAAAIGFGLVLTGMGADYFLDRNLLPALVPLIVAVAAGFATQRAGRAGLLGAGALCALFGLSAVLTATNEHLQRPNWRGVAAALGVASETRVILAPQSALQPLDLYLADARDAPSASISTREIILVDAATPEVQAAALPKGFVPTQQRIVASFQTATYRFPGHVELAPRALSTTAAILTQEPGDVVGEK